MAESVKEENGMEDFEMKEEKPIKEEILQQSADDNGVFIKDEDVKLEITELRGKYKYCFVPLSALCTV